MTIQEYNDIYKNTVIKKMTIATSGGLVIRNSNIASENMSLEESLCSEQNLKFGCCEASCFKVRLLECNHSFLGEWLDVTQTIYTDDDGFLLLENGDYLLTEDGFRIQLESADAFSKYGRFKVYSDKPTNDRMWRDLVCYDVMYDILNADMLPWYNTLTFPMTLKALRDSFFDYLQIPQQTTTLVNDSFQTEGGFLVDGQLSGKTIINAICELNGVFGHISHEGVFEYISLPSADTIALDWYYDGTGAYEGYVVEQITGVRAIGSDADAGTTVGTTDNVYIVNNNPLIYGTEGSPALSTALTNLLNAIKDITYRPFNVTTYGNPMLPLGTNLVINTRDQTINSFVMQRTLKGIQALKDTYKAVGEEKQPDDVNSLQSQIIRSRGKTHEMEVDVNQLKSTINDPDTGVVSVLEQTVERIVMKVDDNGNIVQVQLGKDPDDPSATAFKVSADNIDFIADGVMNLTANRIGINATNFSIDKDTGRITCSAGTIGGWSILQNSLIANNGIYGSIELNSQYGLIKSRTLAEDFSLNIYGDNFYIVRSADNQFFVECGVPKVATSVPNVYRRESVFTMDDEEGNLAIMLESGVPYLNAPSLIYLKSLKDTGDGILYCQNGYIMSDTNCPSSNLVYLKNITSDVQSQLNALSQRITNLGG